MTSTPTRPIDNFVIATKGLQDRNINILAGTTVENKGKLILNINGINNKNDNHVNSTNETNIAITTSNNKFSKSCLLRGIQIVSQ